MRRLLIALCLLVAARSEPAIRLYPVDDTARDPSFESFVRKLRSAVEARSTHALRGLVFPEVVSGPADDDTGWTKFAARWRPDDTESPLWPALSDMLELGFVREHPSLFLSPYLVWRFPAELDRAAYLVVIRDRVALRAAPSLKAPVVDWLSFDVVRPLGRPESGEGLGQWVRVANLSGHTGYVNAKDLMSPLIPRAQFGIRKGKWFLVALEGGA
jgi:hypothetical protein